MFIFQLHYAVRKGCRQGQGHRQGQGQAWSQEDRQDEEAFQEGREEDRQEGGEKGGCGQARKGEGCPQEEGNQALTLKKKFFSYFQIHHKPIEIFNFHTGRVNLISINV